MALQHQFDEDGCCIICDFDGADWYHYQMGRPPEVRDNASMPPCKDKYGRINPGNPDDIFKE